MEADEIRPKADETLRQLEKEELERFSLEELDERMTRLKAEIERAAAKKASKQDSHLAAEAAFKS